MTRMEPTEEMVNALYAWMGAHDVTLPDDALQSLLGILAASPGQGAVTAEQAGKMARAVYEKHQARATEESGTVWEDWEDLHPSCQDPWIDDQIAALTALGLTVQP